MKTWTNLFPQIITFENLYRAAQKARKYKRLKIDTARFDLDLEKNLLRLQAQLQTHTWTPGPYTTFQIYEPKPRLISAAPYPDRVVHHALCNIIEPLFEKTFIHDSYASRPHKGTHRAVDRLTAFCRKNRFALKADIRKYFPSIDHEILYQQIVHKIRDDQLLWLIRTIIDSSNPQEPVHDYFPGDDLFTPFTRRQGLPIGNLTSQFFANAYLNAFDHFIKEQLGGHYYIRYVDDFVVLADDKAFLHHVLRQTSRFMETLRLRLHPTKCQVFPVDQGIDFLGYRVFPNHRRLRRDNVVRFQRRLCRLQNQYQNGELEIEDISRSVQSWVAHAAHANTWGLRRRVLGRMAFQGEPTI